MPKSISLIILTLWICIANSCIPTPNVSNSEKEGGKSESDEFIKDNDIPSQSFPEDDGPEVKFENVQSILNSKCLNCHSGLVNDWGVDFDSSESDWKDRTPSGLIIAGNPNGSTIIQKLIHYNNEGNMPLGSNQTTFPLEDYQTLYKWVEDLGKTNETKSVNDCGTLDHGKAESRIRYQNSVVDYDKQCISETQFRVCSYGVLTSFTGNYQYSSCEISVPPIVETKFETVKNIISTNCLNCHGTNGAGGTQWNISSADSESKWLSTLISTNRIIEGDPDNSNLLKRMIHSGGPIANMPLGQTTANYPISNYNTIKDWIASLINVEVNDDEVDNHNLLSFECEENEEKSVVHRKFRRLTKEEYINTVNYFLASASWRKTTISKLHDLESAIAFIPDDNGNHFKESDLQISEDHIKGYYDAAAKLAEVLNDEYNTDGSRRIMLMGKRYGYSERCLRWGSDYDEDCIKNFISIFGKYIHRRPLTNDEKDFYFNKSLQHPNNQSKLTSLITLFFSAPEFLFHFEGNGDVVNLSNGSKAHKLTNYEIASRLSYTFWKTTPSLDLYELAETEDFHTDEGFAKALAIVFNEANLGEMKITLKSFYDQYLKVGKYLPEFIENRAFTNFKTDINTDSKLKEAISDEIDNFMNHHIWDAKSKFTDMLVSKKYFVNNAELAKVYGLPDQIWDGTSDLSFPESAKRSGLLTRVGMLYTGGYATSPIHTGVFVLENILCEELPSPPPVSESDLVINLSPPYSTREEVHAQTIQNNENCASCHNKINPYGYSFEMYDALGRVRADSKELFYDLAGNITDSVSTDWKTNIVLDESVLAINSPIELSEKLAASKTPNACFSRKLYEYLEKSNTDLSDKSCEMKQIHNAHLNGGVISAFKQYASLFGFRYNKIR